VVVGRSQEVIGIMCDAIIKITFTMNWGVTFMKENASLAKCLRFFRSIGEVVIIGMMEFKCHYWK
jgi:hypothetical protein